MRAEHQNGSGVSSGHLFLTPGHEGWGTPRLGRAIETGGSNKLWYTTIAVYFLKLGFPCYGMMSREPTQKHTDSKLNAFLACSLQGGS